MAFVNGRGYYRERLFGGANDLAGRVATLTIWCMASHVPVRANKLVNGSCVYRQCTLSQRIFTVVEYTSSNYILAHTANKKHNARHSASERHAVLCEFYVNHLSPPATSISCPVMYPVLANLRQRQHKAHRGKVIPSRTYMETMLATS